MNEFKPPHKLEKTTTTTGAIRINLMKTNENGAMLPGQILNLDPEKITKKKWVENRTICFCVVNSILTTFHTFPYLALQNKYILILVYQKARLARGTCHILHNFLRL